MYYKRVLLGKDMLLFPACIISATPPPSTYERFRILREHNGIRCTTYDQNYKSEHNLISKGCGTLQKGYYKVFSKALVVY